MFYKEVAFQDFTTGRIPEDWNVERLQDILVLLKNGLTAKQSREGNGYPITRIETISKERIDPDRVGYSPEVSEREVEACKLVKGDILFSHINSLAHIGKTALYEGMPEILLHGMNLLLLRPDKEKIHPKYLLYAMKLLKMRNVFRSMSKKAVNQASINQTELGRLSIPVPPLQEQELVVETLGVVDSAIELAEKVIAKTKRLKEGLMQKLLTEGIGHKEYKDTPIGKIPNHWQVAQLGEYADFRNGINFNSEQRTSTGTLTIDVRNMYGEGIYVDLKALYRVSISENEDCLLRKGDVLFVRSSLKREGAGWASLFGGSAEPVTFCSFIIRARLREKSTLLPEFLTHFLRSDVARRKLVANAGQVAISNITQDSLNALLFPIPSLKEQQKIADIIATIDEKMRFERIEKTKVEHIKQGLMDLLLTGKVRVKAD